MPLERKIFKKRESYSYLYIWILGVISFVVAFYYNYLMFAIILLFLLLTIQSFQAWKNTKRSFQKNSFWDSLNNLPISILVVSKGVVVYANEYMIRLAGVNEVSEIVGSSISNLLIGDIDNVHDKKECVLKGKENQIYDVEVTSKDFSENGENYRYLILTDISAYKESQKVLEHSEQLTVLGELAAGIAHEIRNPLTSLKGFLQLLKSSNDKNKNSYIEIMLSEIERINKIVGELLILGKPKVTNEYEKKYVVPIIHTVVTIVNTQAILHNIQIELDLERDIETLNIRAEENKLKQVFINVLKNAMEAMASGGTIVIKGRKVDKNLSICFIDDGAGIPTERIPRLGSRFYSTKDNGTGLGLMISFRIIKEHGGKMEIRSAEGKGTEVEIVLPQLQDNKSELVLLGADKKE